ncbi:sodium/potassium/calcium exchanger 3 isoform X1 [Oncorhynchus mykiss]|uniref:Sodium/calcium exchanger membrane region domain-containing protein n=1 Tax=Oncorhynchus mykiss TaxID=8022 RepID=A0A8C7NPQ0_ONCMY|nr:sodium/potassium/calcium exchanger 3 isoform X1 [Oncorhynchus mykiss]
MKAAVRPKRMRLFWRLGVCGVGMITATWLMQLLDVTDSPSPSDVVGDFPWSKRELMQEREEENHTSYTPTTPRAAIHEFPADIFSPEQRRKGAVLLHAVCAIYMFYALAIVCDVYFVPSLEKISENLQLSEDVAGATFMAAGSSAPELFTSLIGVFITKGDLGVGTIVGSAVFNILVIIGICGIFAGQPISLSWWPLLRDSLYYILSILMLIVVIYDDKVIWWETIILISMYLVYIIIMKFNRPLSGWVERHCGRGGQPCFSTLRRTTAVGHGGVDCDTDMVLLKRDSCAGQETAVVMVDELMSLHPHQLSFSEASLHLLITPHFPPYTRLRMAGRMVINERQRLSRARGQEENGGEEGGDGATWEIGNSGAGEERGDGGASWAIENGGAGDSERQPLEGDGDRDGGTEGNTEGLQPEEEELEEEEEVSFSPFIVPGGHCERVRWLVSWPLCLLLCCTVPNCVLPRWSRWYLLTFLASTLWIAVFSYLMVWMVTIISYTLGIPEVVMGITFLAAGTSVPDCMASLIVARQGMGDMAVSNSIGSNIFDVLLGLGFPWFLRTLVVDYGSVVYINSKGLVYSVVLLLGSVFLTVLSVHLNRWWLDRRLGLCLMMLYVIFLLCSVGFQRL